MAARRQKPLSGAPGAHFYACRQDFL